MKSALLLLITGVIEQLSCASKEEALYLYCGAHGLGMLAWPLWVVLLIPSPAWLSVHCKVH
jgi:hypothetical protein